MVNDIVELQPQLKKYGILNGEPNTAKQIVDGRKGYLSRFSYCPYCGNKIDWKTVLSCCCITEAIWHRKPTTKYNMK